MVTLMSRDDESSHAHGFDADNREMEPERNLAPRP